VNQKTKVPLKEVKWDKENHLVEIYPQEPVLQTALSWYFLTLKIQTSVELTISTANLSWCTAARYVGTWILNIG